MKVLLLNPPYVENFMRNARCEGVSISGTQWYPIWLSYCGALLEKEGHTVKLIDAPAENMMTTNVLLKIIEFKPDFVLVYSSTRSFEDDFKLAKLIKGEINTIIVFVGPWVTINPENILKSCSSVDYVTYGEFDYTILELVSGKTREDILGLVCRKNGVIVRNPIRPLMNSDLLDKLPFVTQFYSKHLNLHNYRVVAQRFPFIDMFTGRGCSWGQCTFCLWVNTLTQPGNYRHRSATNVVEEMKWVKDNLPQVKEIFFQDDMLPADWAEEISDEILKQGLVVTWGGYVKGDLKLETLQKMKKAGCRILHVGYESGDSTILTNIKKGVTKKVLEDFTKNANKAGIKIHADFVVGFPGETKETIKQTIKWANTLDVDSIQYSIPALTEITPMYQQLKQEGCLNQDQVDYPHMRNDEIREWAKIGTRSYYLNSRYLLRTLKDPPKLIQSLYSAWYTIPALFWKKW